MNVIDRAGDAISNVPRPFLIGGAVIGAGIGGVILWRRRNADPNAGGSISSDEKNYGQASQSPSSDFGVYAGTTSGEYTSTVASDYPTTPLVSVGAGALSLEDLLGSYQDFIDFGQQIWGSGAGTGGTTDLGGNLGGAGGGAAQAAPEAPPAAPAIVVPAPAPAPTVWPAPGATPPSPPAVTSGAWQPTPEKTYLRPSGGAWDGSNVYQQTSGSRAGMWYYVVVRNGVKYRYYQNGDVVKA